MTGVTIAFINLICSSPLYDVNVDSWIPGPNDNIADIESAAAAERVAICVENIILSFDNENSEECKTAVFEFIVREEGLVLNTGVICLLLAYMEYGPGNIKMII
jgi:hypothetical protein